MKKYKNYIFDFYGTLVDIVTDESKLALWEAMADVYNSFGCNYRPRQLRSAFQAIASEEEQLLKGLGHQHVEIDLETVFVRLLTEAKYSRQTENKPADLQTFGQLAATVFRVLSREKLEAYETTLPSLQAIKEEGARLFILSNAQRIFTQAEIELTGCADLMEKIYISSDFKIKKPEPAFLRMVIEENGLKPEETVIVGNDLTSDIAIGQELGIDSILLNTFPYSVEEIEAYRNVGWHFTVIEDLAELIG